METLPEYPPPLKYFKLLNREINSFFNYVYIYYWILDICYCFGQILFFILIFAIATVRIHSNSKFWMLFKEIFHIHISYISFWFNFFINFVYFFNYWSYNCTKFYTHHSNGPLYQLFKYFITHTQSHFYMTSLEQ